VFADPQIEARGLLVEQHLAEGRPPLKTLGNPIRLSRTPVRYGEAPPRLGAHTEEILREVLGMPKSGFDRLLEQGTVAQSGERAR
jgi:crotonobetainyl-CoA:carnitine CoA-transferase CaiB-like acyl-CoA transferase